jgi:hypothetical protein
VDEEEFLQALRQGDATNGWTGHCYPIVSSCCY